MTIPAVVLENNPRFAGRLVARVLVPQFTFAMDEQSDPVLRSAAAFRFGRDAVRWIFAFTSESSIPDTRAMLGKLLGEPNLESSGEWNRGYSMGSCHELLGPDRQHAYIATAVVPATSILAQQFALGTQGRFHLERHVSRCLIGLLRYLHCVHPTEVSAGAKESAPPRTDAPESEESVATSLASDGVDTSDLPFCPPRKEPYHELDF